MEFQQEINVRRAPQSIKDGQYKKVIQALMSDGAGQVPFVVALLCGANLFACKKKGGGLHPIAVGEVFRRLTSNCISRAV